MLLSLPLSRVGRSLALLLGFLAVVSACGASEPAATNEYGVLAITAVLPEAFDLMEAVDAAGQPVTQECMELQGFEYFPPVVDESPLAIPEAPPLTPERAEMYGYQVPELTVDSPAKLERMQSESEYRDSLTAAELDRLSKALFGTEETSVEIDGGRLSMPSDGCLAEGRASVAGSIETRLLWDTAWQNILAARSHASERSLADPLVREAETQWIMCMSENGYSFDGIREANRDFARAPTGETVQAQYGDATLVISVAEIEQASVDAGCRAETSYHDIYLDRLSIFENEALREDESVLINWTTTATAIRASLAGLSE